MKRCLRVSIISLTIPEAVRKRLDVVGSVGLQWEGDKLTPTPVNEPGRKGPENEQSDEGVSSHYPTLSLSVLIHIGSTSCIPQVSFALQKRPRYAQQINPQPGEGATGEDFIPSTYPPLSQGP